MTPDLHKLAAGLTEAETRILTDNRFNPKGWEPSDPFNPLMGKMVEGGLFVRRDGRCCFEAFKDSFVVPTPLAIALRALLNEERRS